MSSDAVAIAAIVMTGVFLSVVAWQLLGIARTAVARRGDADAERLEQRLEALEEVHRTGDAGDTVGHRQGVQR